MSKFNLRASILKYTVKLPSTEADIREGNPPRDNFVSYSLALDNALATSAWQQAVSTANRYDGDIYGIYSDGDEQLFRSYRQGVSVKKFARV